VGQINDSDSFQRSRHGMHLHRMRGWDDVDTRSHGRSVRTSGFVSAAMIGEVARRRNAEPLLCPDRQISQGYDRG
jgi:hypothetical protein